MLIRFWGQKIKGQGHNRQLAENLVNSDVTSTKTLKYKYEYKYPSLKYEYKYPSLKYKYKYKYLVFCNYI